MHRELFDKIQTNIHRHGRIKSVRLLNCSEYTVEHQDGFAYVVSDARQGVEGPIQSVGLYDGPDQGIATDFRILKSFVLFEGPEHQQRDSGAIPSDSVEAPGLQHAT